MEAPTVYLEIRHSSLKALRGETTLELPLERTTTGGLTAACRQKLVSSLQPFLKKEIWQPRPRAFCAIGARGVSLRRLTLPATNKDELKRLLVLQIESEFPLPPDALAWGYRALANGGPKQELLVVAVKKEVVEEYATLLTECGATPVFTVAALARRYAQPNPPSNCALLDIGRNYAELIFFEQGQPRSVRVLPWGGENMTHAIAQQLGMDRNEAEKLKIELAHNGSSHSEAGPRMQAAIDGALDALATAINGHLGSQKLYISGRSTRVKEFAARLAKRLGPGADCELLKVSGAEGQSAAIAGLRAAVANAKESPLVLLESAAAEPKVSLAQPILRKWGALAGALLLLCLVLPYLEAPLLKGRLERKLKAIQADRGRLVTIDRELEFLRSLKQSQPPYLDALFLMSKAAVQGTKFDSITMNRRGDLSLRCTMKDGQQVVAFRTKLIDSGFFASVAVEEQTPTPDRQKVNVRLTARWKPAADRQSLAIGPTAEELEKAKNRPKDTPGGAFPGMEMGMPPGMPMMPPMGGGGPMPGRSRRISMPGPPGQPMPPMPPGQP